jgi:hypothetical protein
MVRGSGAHATDRPVLAPLFFEVWSAEQPAANAALPSVHREERSSTRGACERQAHDSIVAQSGNSTRYCGRKKRRTSKRELIDTVREQDVRKAEPARIVKDMDDVGRSLTAERASRSFEPLREEGTMGCSAPLSQRRALRLQRLPWWDTPAPAGLSLPVTGTGLASPRIRKTSRRSGAAATFVVLGLVTSDSVRRAKALERLWT